MIELFAQSCADSAYQTDQSRALGQRFASRLLLHLDLVHRSETIRANETLDVKVG